jgi:Ala-tRNA(Pro) deacylase
MTDTVTDRLKKLLEASQVEHQLSRHAPVFTSEEAAAIRGTPLASGAKALICRADGRFLMFVLPADRRLASKQVRRTATIGSLRFATREEVAELTGLAPGSIPPFGSLFGLPTYCDSGLAENDQINFNAGDHCVSISMRSSDYVRVERPEMGSFAE